MLKCHISKSEMSWSKLENFYYVRKTILRAICAPSNNVHEHYNKERMNLIIQYIYMFIIYAYIILKKEKLFSCRGYKC